MANKGIFQIKGKQGNNIEKELPVRKGSERVLLRLQGNGLVSAVRRGRLEAELQSGTNTMWRTGLPFLCLQGAAPLLSMLL